MPIEYTIILSIVTAGIALMGVATGRTTLRRLQQQDNKAEGASMATIQAQLDHIDRNIISMGNSMENIRVDIKEQFERVVRVEESAKQAHKRLDELMGRKGAG